MKYSNFYKIVTILFSPILIIIFLFYHIITNVFDLILFNNSIINFDYYYKYYFRKLFTKIKPNENN